MECSSCSLSREIPDQKKKGGGAGKKVGGREEEQVRRTLRDWQDFHAILASFLITV